VLQNEQFLVSAELDQGERNDLLRLLATNEQIDKLRRDIGTEITPAQFDIWGISVDDAMRRIHIWWKAKRVTSNYRTKIYPGEIDLNDKDVPGGYDRSSWLTLLALGAFQSIGFSQEGHHRSFLQLCRAKGWWRTFSEKDPVTNPDEWMDIIGEYADNQTDNQEWNQWMAQFPNLYRLARWLDEYRELFLSINRFNRPFKIDEIRTPKASFIFQGTNIEAPPINRTLKNGSYLIIRELLHYGILKNEHAIPHAYAPIKRIKDLYERFDYVVSDSQDIHAILENALGPDGACFHGDYDIPLRIVAGDEKLQFELFSK
jgi:hypothetical protein